MRGFFRALCAVATLSLMTVATPAEARGGYLQCVPFARLFSGVELFGNAFTWWDQAVGKYARGTTPQAGAVLVFKALGSMRVGHVATVTKIISDRIINVTHANWSSHGRIERDVTVIDASDAGDWTKVKVWYAPTQGLGSKTYPVYGFIYGGKPGASEAAKPA